MSYAKASLGAATTSLGQLVTTDGFRYQITEEDRLWAARAVACEGGGLDGQLAALWTWAARFTLPNFRSRYGTLAALIRAHSQPVNPKWTATGSMCGPGGQYAGSSTYCSASQLQRRALCAGRSWSAIPAATRDIVDKWVAADLPNPVPRAVDFASSSLGKQSGDVEVARFGASGSSTSQVFYSEEASRSRPTDFLTIQYNGKVAGPTITGMLRAAPMIGIAAVTAAAGFAGWAYWRSRRRRTR